MKLKLSAADQLNSGRVVELGIWEAVAGVGVEMDEELTDVEAAEVAGKVRWMLQFERYVTRRL